MCKCLIRFVIFGKKLAMKLWDLPKQQRIICEKIINNTLCMPEMGSLTHNHKLSNEKSQLLLLVINGLMDLNPFQKVWTNLEGAVQSYLPKFLNLNFNW